MESIKSESTKSKFFVREMPRPLFRWGPTILAVVIIPLSLLLGSGKFDDVRLKLFRGGAVVDRLGPYCEYAFGACQKRVGYHEDGACAYATVADGAHCTDISRLVCAEECTCQAGKPVMTIFTCDDGNPCTRDSCRCRYVRVDMPGYPGGKLVGREGTRVCHNELLPEGTACHPDANDASCMQGLCVYHTSGKIYTTDPVQKKIIFPGDRKKE